MVKAEIVAAFNVSNMIYNTWIYTEKFDFDGGIFNNKSYFFS